MNPRVARECSKTACDQPAVSTLAYAYAEATAILGPLTKDVEPHAYDLCAHHSERLTVPRGWTIIRVPSGKPDELEQEDQADLDFFVPDLTEDSDVKQQRNENPIQSLPGRRQTPRRPGSTNSGQRHLRLVPNSNSEGEQA